CRKGRTRAIWARSACASSWIADCTPSSQASASPWEAWKPPRSPAIARRSDSGSEERGSRGPGAASRERSYIGAGSRSRSFFYPDRSRRMAGHSKWKQIKHYKAATDAKRGALFTKLIREITIAAKQGGGDPNGNARLRTAIDAAKASSMPKDNIERAIKKGTGELEGVDYQEVVYEGYGPGGVALVIAALTDNPTRTVADVRHKMCRLGGNLGTPNSVAFLFDKKGQLTIDAKKFDEDSTLEAALDAGAEDFARDEDIYVVTTSPADFHSVKSALEARKI